MSKVRLPQADQDKLRRLLAEAEGRGAEHADGPAVMPGPGQAREALKRYCDHLRVVHGQAPRPGTPAPRSGRKTLQQMRAELARAEREV